MSRMLAYEAFQHNDPEGSVPPLLFILEYITLGHMPVYVLAFSDLGLGFDYNHT